MQVGWLSRCGVLRLRSALSRATLLQITILIAGIAARVRSEGTIMNKDAGGPGVRVCEITNVLLNLRWLTRMLARGPPGGAE